MSAAEQIAKLEGLLARIRTNAAARRGSGSLRGAVFGSSTGDVTGSAAASVAPSSFGRQQAVVASQIPVSAPRSPGVAPYSSPSTIPIEDVDIEDLDGELVEIDSQGMMTLAEDAATFAPEARSIDTGAPALASTEATLPLDLYAAPVSIESPSESPTREMVAVTTEATAEVGTVTVEMTAPTEDEAELLAAIAEPPLEMAVEVSSTFSQQAPAFGEHPTMEQLGATVDLEGSAGDEPEAELELDTSAMEPPPAPAHFEPTPQPSHFPGAYDDSLRPPPEAQHDLQEHDHRSETAGVVPHVVGRSESHRPVVVAEIIDDRRPFAGRSFGELLDDALELTE